MAVRRLGQSVTDLLRQRNAVSRAATSICSMQQRNFADQPEQKELNGIPVEVFTCIILRSCLKAIPTLPSSTFRHESYT